MLDSKAHVALVHHAHALSRIRPLLGLLPRLQSLEHQCLLLLLAHALLTHHLVGLPLLVVGCALLGKPPHKLKPVRGDYGVAVLASLMEEGRNERAGQSNELRRLLAQQAEQGRQDRLSQSLALRELLAGKKSEEKAAAPQFKEADIQKLSAFADKKQLPRLLPQARQLLKAIEAAGDKDIPGLTSTDQMLVRAPGGTRLLSKDAIDNHTALQGILNALTRADAGLSQTQGEVVRQALETLNSVPASSQVRAQVLKKHILPILEQQRSAVLGSASPAALAEYRSRQQAIGGEVDWLDPLMGTPGPDPDQALIEKYLPKPKGK